MDLDSKNKKDFLLELDTVLASCQTPPSLIKFCLAIEEGESWFLGDINAILKAYPKMKKHVTNTYTSDSICGTWEVLANAIYPKGLEALKKQGVSRVGIEKSKWAKEITPHMDIENNKSPSFCYFRDTLYHFISD